MCLILLACHSHPRWSLILAANRDEWRQRPAAPLRAWTDTPIVAGMDLTSRGTWMAVRRDGAWAAVTNVREPGAAPGPRSRGELPLRALQGAPTTALGQIAREGQAWPGFHLLVGDADATWHMSNRGEPPSALDHGLHGISNGPLGARWPKVTGGLAAMRTVISQDDIDPGSLMDLLADRTPADDAALPDTGVGLEMERALSPRFIDLPSYGTRVSTVVLLSPGEVRVVERTHDPGGGQVDLRWTPTAR